MKVKIGQRVRVCFGSGLDSNKTGRIVPKSSVRTNGRGVPELTGHYKPITSRESLIRYDDGTYGTMFNNRLIEEVTP